MGTPAYKLSLPNKPDLLSVLTREGVILRQQGRNYIARCVAHSPDKNPSMVIYPDTGKAHCFSCGFHGDRVDVVIKLHGLSFPEALAYLGIEKGRPEPARIAEDKRRKEVLSFFRQWEKEMSNLLAEALMLYRRKEAAGFTWREALVLSDVLQDIPYVEWLYEEVFCKNDDEAKLQIFKQEYGLE